MSGARQTVTGISSAPASGPHWPEECSHEHPLCPRFTARAARAPRPSGRSSITPGIISSPATRSTTAAPWDHCARMPSPPSAPFSGAAISPQASPAFTRLETGGRRLEGAHSWEIRPSVFTSSLAATVNSRRTCLRVSFSFRPTRFAADHRRTAAPSASSPHRHDLHGVDMDRAARAGDEENKVTD